MLRLQNFPHRQPEKINYNSVLAMLSTLYIYVEHLTYSPQLHNPGINIISSIVIPCVEAILFKLLPAMGRRTCAASLWITAILTLLAVNVYVQGIEGATMTVKNQCSYTVWAAGSPGGGKQLGQGETWSFDVPAGTTGGRIWGRTGCSFDAGSGTGSCTTGDCGGLLNCQGYGSVPATLFEYGLNKYQNLDFYDISLVDGFNIPLSVTPSDSSCKVIGCTTDINAVCPAELKVTDGCKSACAEYNTPQYCCTGDYLNNCSPTNYSQFFKGQCPQAYSYAKDDATSTFTCPGGANYNVVFCG